MNDGSKNPAKSTAAAAHFPGTSATARPVAHWPPALSPQANYRAIEEERRKNKKQSPPRIFLLLNRNAHTHTKKNKSPCFLFAKSNIKLGKTPPPKKKAEKIQQNNQVGSGHAPLPKLRSSAIESEFGGGPSIK